MKNKAVSGIMLTLLLTSILTLAFNIQPVRASGTIYIRADGSIDPSTAPIQRDGDVYTFTDNIVNQSIVVERDNIMIDGADYTLEGPGALQPTLSRGISLSGRNNVTIKNMKIREFFYGIELNMSSNNNAISGNDITNNGIDIDLSWSSNNIISGNNITNNQLGIQLLFSSNNTVSENNITNNDYGIQLNSHSMFGYSSNNTICHNNFIDNTQQVDVIELGDIPTFAYTNFWDDGYPSGGNCWSDYVDRYPNSEEIDESGIWDTPYVINENNQDNYPLISPWGTILEEEDSEEIPFWMQWWFIAIVAVVIIPLAGTVYFLKKRKPPTPTAPSPPPETTVE